MDRPVLIVEAPLLDDDAVVEMKEFLYAFINAFENLYDFQLKRHSDQKYFDCPNLVEVKVDLIEGELPF